MQILTTKDLEKEENLYWQLCIYGAPGVGKTVFGGSSNTLRTLFIDTEKGLLSVPAWRKKHKLDPKLVDFIRVTTKAEFNQALVYMCQNLEKYDLLVIDTMTELQRLIMQEGGSLTKTLTMTQRDWGDIRYTFEQYFSTLRKLPINIIVLCHEWAKVDESTGREIVRPSFDGRIGAEYARHFSIIGRAMLAAKEIRTGDIVTYEAERALRFGLDLRMATKDRSGLLREYEPMNIDALFTRLNSAIIGNAEDLSEAEEAEKEEMMPAGGL